MAKQKAVAVRWIGAFGDPSLRPRTTKGLEKSVRFELARDDEASFAIQEPGTRVGRAQVGLLVDLQKSRIGKIYAGDAWTIRLDCGRLIATRSKTVPPDGRCVRDETFREYDEGFGYLVYSGIVVHRHANKKARNSARLVAERVGLPYLGTLK
jgi:hypothetical protein